MEILVLHPGALGDVILSLPALALLREKYPAARITIAVNTDYLMPVAHGYAEKVISLSTLPLHILYSDSDLPVSDLRFWNSFDYIVSWTGSGAPGFAEKMKAICPGARVESWRPAPQEPRHVSQLFIDSLGTEIASRKKADYAPIFLSPESNARGLQWLSRQGWRREVSLVALHPGAGSESKRWPLNRFISLARHLIHSHERRVLIIEGPAEEGLADRMVQDLPKDKLILARFISLDILASVIAKADAFVGNDSGIAHLAAALGVPSVVLFGPTQPRHWAPLGPHVKILQDASLQNIAVERVIHALLSV